MRDNCAPYKAIVVASAYQVRFGFESTPRNSPVIRSFPVVLLLLLLVRHISAYPCGIRHMDSPLPLPALSLVVITYIIIINFVIHLGELCMGKKKKRKKINKSWTNLEISGHTFSFFATSFSGFGHRRLASLVYAIHGWSDFFLTSKFCVFF